MELTRMADTATLTSHFSTMYRYFRELEIHDQALTDRQKVTKTMCKLNQEWYKLANAWVITQPDNLSFDQFRMRLIRMDADGKIFSDSTKSHLLHLQGPNSKDKHNESIFTIQLEDEADPIPATTTTMVGPRVGQVGVVAGGTINKQMVETATTAGSRDISRETASLGRWNVINVTRRDITQIHARITEINQHMLHNTLTLVRAAGWLVALNRFLWLEDFQMTLFVWMEQRHLTWFLSSFRKSAIFFNNTNHSKHLE
jgi:hypothetical protein